MRAPTPENKRPTIPSAGLGYMKATRHVFVETRACVLPSPDGDGWEFIFKCEETGVTRRYGVEDRRVPSWERDGN